GRRAAIRGAGVLLRVRAAAAAAWSMNGQRPSALGCGRADSSRCDRRPQPCPFVQRPAEAGPHPRLPESAPTRSDLAGPARLAPWECLAGLRAGPGRRAGNSLRPPRREQIVGRLLACAETSPYPTALA